ncbi:serine aminopeptidase domain-containing protein [Shigella flexneri]
MFHSGFEHAHYRSPWSGRSGGEYFSPIHIAVMSITFNDYVDNLTAFSQQEVLPGPWRKRYILAHSMGGAIATLFLQRRQSCDAIALCAPMFGI